MVKSKKKTVQKADKRVAKKKTVQEAGKRIAKKKALGTKVKTAGVARKVSKKTVVKPKRGRPSKLELLRKKSRPGRPRKVQVESATVG